MKIGKKGFMLAEVVVVSVVVVTVLVALFTGVNNVSSAYETRNRYYDVDSLYVAMEINDILLKNVDSLDGLISDAKRVYNFALESDDIDENNIQDFGDFYGDVVGDEVISYITPYNREIMLSLESYDGTTTVTFDEYLDYLSNNLNFDDENYNYMIIVERRAHGNVDDCYYYALKLKY